MIKNKKGQEEIIGFVLIVVIVAIIFLIFLGIFIRQKAPATQKESTDVYQFLQSMMEYTSDCAISYEPAFSNLGTLVKDCNADSMCKSGESACNTLNRTLRGAIESNWKIGPSTPYKGYVFNATYSSDSRVKEVMFITAGNCSRTGRIGAEYLSPAYPGTIASSLEICLA
jgi:competence protein ComGC